MSKEKKFKAFHQGILYSVAFPSWNGNIIVWKDNVPFTEEVALPPTVGDMPKLLQWSGEIDSNKTEIYEDDIIEVTYDDGHEKYITKVQGPHQAFSVEVRDCDYDFTSLCWLQDAMPDVEVKVIGNANKYPELLKK